MSVGDKPAFPPMHDPDRHDSGMTYRQWLIGMIACGEQAWSPPDARMNPTPETPHGIIKRVDSIIAALDAEQQKGGEN